MFATRHKFDRGKLEGLLSLFLCLLLPFHLLLPLQQLGVFVRTRRYFYVKIIPDFSLLGRRFAGLRVGERASGLVVKELGLLLLVPMQLNPRVLGVNLIEAVLHLCQVIRVDFIVLSRAGFRKISIAAELEVEGATTLLLRAHELANRLGDDRLLRAEGVAQVGPTLDAVARYDKSVVVLLVGFMNHRVGRLQFGLVDLFCKLLNELTRVGNLGVRDDLSLVNWCVYVYPHAL